MNIKNNATKLKMQCRKQNAICCTLYEKINQYRNCYLLRNLYFLFEGWEFEHIWKGVSLQHISDLIVKDCIEPYCFMKRIRKLQKELQKKRISMKLSWFWPSGEKVWAFIFSNKNTLTSNILFVMKFSNLTTTLRYS